MRRFFEEQVWGERDHPSFLVDTVRMLMRFPEACFKASVGMRNLLYDRCFIRSAAAPIPIVSVGGIEVGGVGKTPMAMELARLAKTAGFRPAILTRGYGRRKESREASARRVDLDAARRDWRVFGDEPVLLAEMTDAVVWVAPRRLDAARLASENGSDIGILDDGFQHRALARDLDIVCLDARRPFGNGRLLPAGPLREDPLRALRRADRIVLSGGPPDVCAEAAVRLRAQLGARQRILSWHGHPSLQGLQGDPPHPGEPVFLAAGIAHPTRLVRALEELGHPVAGQAFFPDHHPFEHSDIERITAGCGSPSGIVVTSEKDWIRLRGMVAGSGHRWAVLKRRLLWNESNAEESWIQDLRRLGPG